MNRRNFMGMTGAGLLGLGLPGTSRGDVIKTQMVRMPETLQGPSYDVIWIGEAVNPHFVIKSKCLT